MGGCSGHTGDFTAASGPRPPGHLRRLRLLRGWTQAALSQAAGIDRKTLLALELERSQPQLRTAQKLAAAMKMEVAALFPSGFTIAEHDERTPGLTGPEKLQAFGALPQAQQDEATRNIAGAAEADRALRGE